MKGNAFIRNATVQLVSGMIASGELAPETPPEEVVDLAISIAKMIEKKAR